MVSVSATDNFTVDVALADVLEVHDRKPVPLIRRLKRVAQVRQSGYATLRVLSGLDNNCQRGYDMNTRRIEEIKYPRTGSYWFSDL